MREILFRGKCQTGEWVEGGFLNRNGKPEIVDWDKAEEGNFTFTTPVDPSTVGQFTDYEIGGQKLFEGDIVRLDYEPAWDESAGEYRYSQTAWGAIVFESGMFLFKEYRGVHNINTSIERDLFVWELYRMYEGTWLDRSVSRAKHAEIIGNIYDNPELLEEEQYGSKG